MYVFDALLFQYAAFSSQCVWVELTLFSEVWVTNKHFFTRPQADLDNFMHSFVVSELSAKTLKSHSEGKFVKERLVAAAKLLAPDKVKLFQSVSLSPKAFSDRAIAIAEDIEKALKDTSRDFQFSLWPTNKANTTHPAIFVNRITVVFDTREEMLSLRAMFGTTKSKDMFEQATNKFNLQFDKSSGLTRDGAPAIAGGQKGLTALIKKEISCLILSPSELVVCHCIIHQDACVHIP